MNRFIEGLTTAAVLLGLVSVGIFGGAAIIAVYMLALAAALILVLAIYLRWALVIIAAALALRLMGVI